MAEVEFWDVRTKTKVVVTRYAGDYSWPTLEESGMHEYSYNGAKWEYVYPIDMEGSGKLKGLDLPKWKKKEEKRTGYKFWR